MPSLYKFAENINNVFIFKINKFHHDFIIFIKEDILCIIYIYYNKKYNL